MKIFFSQPFKFISLMASDGPVAAPAAGKFRLGRPIFLLISLLLGVSACAGTTIEAPSQLPREVTPGSPLSAAVVNQFPSHVTGGGSLRVFSVYSEGGYSFKVNKDLQLGLAVNYSFNEFHFTGLNFYVPRPWSDVHSFGGSFNVLYTLNDKWSLMFVPIIQAAGEPGADFSRALIYGGGGAAVYKFGKDRSIGLGIGAINNLEQATIFPMVVINWKFNEYFRLSTPYRASPAGPGGAELTYYPFGENKDLRIGLGATYLSKRFRLKENDQNSASNGVGEYDTLPIFVRLSYRFLPVMDVNLYGGCSPYNYILVDDHRGGRLFHTHQNVAPFIGIGLSLNLEKYMGGGG